MSSEDEEIEIREHPEFSPQKLALYDDLDRSRRSASPILRVPSPAGGALLSEASIKRAQQSSRASSPRISEARKPSPLFGRSASPFSGDSWGPSGASDDCIARRRRRAAAAAAVDGGRVAGVLRGAAVLEGRWGRLGRVRVVGLARRDVTKCSSRNMARFWI